MKMALEDIAFENAEKKQALLDDQVTEEDMQPVHHSYIAYRATKRNNRWNIRKKKEYALRVQQQLETDERIYGGIGRENQPSWTGWKESPQINLQSLKEERHG